MLNKPSAFLLLLLFTFFACEKEDNICTQEFVTELVYVKTSGGKAVLLDSYRVIDVQRKEEVSLEDPWWAIQIEKMVLTSS